MSSAAAPSKRRILVGSGNALSKSKHLNIFYRRQTILFDRIIHGMQFSFFDIRSGGGGTGGQMTPHQMSSFTGYKFPDSDAMPPTYNEYSQFSDHRMHKYYPDSRVGRIR